ncbi:MAG: hypothetical protein IT436_16090 [Phycisphaerales bacterium]|nr:hypothetical protein [Phycisphaerales bacterium]
MHDSRTHLAHFKFIALAATVVAQGTTLADVSVTTISITGEINGQPLAGAGLSTLELDTGFARTEIVFSSVPTGFDPVAYGKSWKTKHHPHKPPVLAGAASFFMLSPAGYTFQTAMTYDGGSGFFENSGSVISTGPLSDTYSLDVRGTYSGPSGVTGIEALGGRFGNLPGIPGAVGMLDTELIQFASGETIGISETGTFILASGAMLPVDPQFLVFDPVVFSFDSLTGTLVLETRAVFIPAPASLMLLLASGIVAVRRRR